MCRVLILDDDLFGAETVKMVLESSGNTQADVTTQLEEALERTAQASRKGEPYEVFLIDLLLGPGKNGIEAMRDLRLINPDSDAIIFTGYGDSENGLSAYRAGAFRYLAKPFDNQELLFLIESLKEWRKNQREQDWQKIFGNMLEAALKQNNFHETARVVLESSLKLGFERAHLFWTPANKDANRKNQLVGVECAGKGCIPNFKDGIFSDWFDLHGAHKSHDAFFLRAEDVKTKKAQIEGAGYQLPSGEMAILPLWRGLSLTGYLLLDHGQSGKVLSSHERNLLNLFVRQVSVITDHASLYGREKWAAVESEIIRYIGRQATTKAASVDLVNLLEEIRAQVGKLMDVTNFAVALLDEETNALDFRLLYDNGKRREGVRRPANQGLEGYLITLQREIFLPNNVKQFITKNEIDFKGEIPSSWLGTPLRVNDKIIGGIFIHQHAEREKPLEKHDQRLLASVANQVAGIIQTSKLVEAEKEDTRRMQILQRASVEMLRIGRENEAHLWLTVLTLATANFGLGLNRALLFLAQDNHRLLCGKCAIGTEDIEEARHDWERDKKRRYDFDAFIKDLGTKHMRHTAFEKVIGKVKIGLNGGQDAVSLVMKTGKRRLLSEVTSVALLPIEITRKFSLGQCAILPLRAGTSILGVVIVDNKHTQKALDEKSLDRLQTLLDNAGLVWETLHESRKSESLLDANYKIMGGASRQPLYETLGHICQTARIISEADWAIIYPIQPDKTPLEFDLQNVGYAGDLQGSLQQAIQDQPRVGGISVHVLRRGDLVIEDTDSADAVVGHQRLSDHHFLKVEGVKAMIGAAIRDPNTDEPLGLLYLDYRKTRSFSETELHHAASFASLAAVAIASMRRYDELRQHKRLEAALQTAEAIGTALNLEKMLEGALQKLHEFFEETRLCVLLYLEDENSLQFAPATLKFYKIETPQYKRQDRFRLDEGSIACRVAQKALESKKVEFENVPDVNIDPNYLRLNQRTQSELCIGLLDTGNELLGVLVLEKNEAEGFSDDDVALVKTVAQQLSLGIERAQKSEKLEFKSTVAAQTSWAADIAHDINNEVGQIRTWAYLIKAQVDEASAIYDFAHKIEESAQILSSTGPWSDQPDQILPLDPMLERYIHTIVRQKNIHAEVFTEAHKVYVKVNQTEFQRVLRQLVRNAAKAMSNVAEKKIIVRTRPLGADKVEILFQDFGPGISDEVRLSIFQRPVTTKGRGGYGLLLTRQMLEDMHGEIKLLSYQKGQGATFSIQLPVAVPVDDSVE